MRLKRLKREPIRTKKRHASHVLATTGDRLALLFLVLRAACKVLAKASQTKESNFVSNLVSLGTLSSPIVNMAEKDGVAMLSMIAAAAESGSLDSFRNDVISPTIHGVPADRSSSSSPRPKLVLPDMTPEVRKDLESGRGSTADPPLSISKRPEWADYRLKDITQPHPNDVREFTLQRCIVSLQLAHVSCSLVSLNSLRPRRRLQQPPWQRGV